MESLQILKHKHVHRGNQVSVTFEKTSLTEKCIIAEIYNRKSFQLYCKDSGDWDGFYI